MTATEDVSVGDHVAPAGSDAPVYRVVGTGDPVALLQVTDGSGRRAATGHLERVDRDRLAGDFVAAENPAAGLTPVRTLRNQLTGLYWQFRKFV